jgi:2-oxoglutarate ferredoxin oxidoreductase subunit beta
MTASGASYVARWTVIHIHQLENAIAETMVRPGFNFIEVIAPCPPVYGRMNKKPSGMDSLHYYQEKSIIRNGADPRDADIELNGTIVVGKFVDKKRPTLWDNLSQIFARANETKSKV